jgi:hypothetical protein
VLNMKLLTFLFVVLSVCMPATAFAQTTDSTADGTDSALAVVKKTISQDTTTVGESPDYKGDYLWNQSHVEPGEETKAKQLTKQDPDDDTVPSAQDAATR